MSKSKAFFQFLNIIFYPFHNYSRKFKNVNVDRDIVYDKVHEKCVGDMLYVGNKEEKKPVFFNIHGGGFIYGDKLARDSIAHRYAQLGYYVFNINYRLVETHPFFTSTIDCINALNFLPELALTYNLDLDNIIISGDSAGAYLALQIYVSSINEEYREKLSLPKLNVKIKKQVLFCGPYDATKVLVKKSLFDINREIAEKACEMKFDKKFENITSYKHYNEVNLLNWMPEKGFSVIPTFIVCSRIDFFCPGDGENLIKLYEDRGFPFQSFRAHRIIDNHSFHLLQFTKVSKNCLAKMDKFIKED